MTKKSDINERLTYTFHCGWIDKGHSNSKPDKNYLRGIYNLWEQIITEKNISKCTINGESTFFAEHLQEMSGFNGLIRVGESRKFLVKRGTNLLTKKNIACRILLAVTDKFEATQGSFPWNLKSGASSYSLEDTTSNFIGLFTLINGVDPEDFLKNVCQEVPKEESLRIWDENFEGLPDGIGNTNFKQAVEKYNKPSYFKTEHFKGNPTFPSILDTLRPASFGPEFIPINISIDPSTAIYHFKFSNRKILYKREGSSRIFPMPAKIDFY